MAENKPNKQPRVRKIETVRQRNEKVAAKAEAKAGKVRLKRTRTAAKTAAKPFVVFKKPLSIISWPFRTRPMRFVGRVLGRGFHSRLQEHA